jgi:hypothetical protein
MVLMVLLVLSLTFLTQYLVDDCSFRIRFINRVHEKISDYDE